MVTSVSSTSSISQLFAKLDTKNQGYLEQSDLISAFSQINSNSNSAASDVFSALDSDSDGKVTESEFSTTLAKLQAELESQFNQMRMKGHGGHEGQGMSGMPPPPQNDTGFTKDELTSQLSEIGSTDSKRSSFISNIVQNFSAADTNGDGKVSMAEAKAFSSDSSTSGSSTSSGTTTTSSGTNSSAASTDAQVMFQIMQLMHAYGNFGDSQQNSSSSLLGTLSVSA